MGTVEIIAYPLISIHIYMDTHKYAWIPMRNMTGFIQWIRVDASATSERSYPVAEMCDKVAGVSFCESINIYAVQFATTLLFRRGRAADTKHRLHSKIGVGWLDCLAGLTGWLVEPLAKQLAYLRRQKPGFTRRLVLVGWVGWLAAWLAGHTGWLAELMAWRATFTASRRRCSKAPTRPRSFFFPAAVRATVPREFRCPAESTSSCLSRI